MVKHYLAVDLGASSGRTIVGSLDQGKLRLRELNRFWNGPTEIGGTLYWINEIGEGRCLPTHFGLFDVNGNLLRNPVHYRDARTAGMFDKVFERVPREEVFAQTGIQFMEINTLYQLMSLSLRDAFQYRSASRMLFVPDLLNYWLTG